MKSLQRVLLPLFLLFYFASSLAATQYRVAEASRRVVYAAMETHSVELTDWNEFSRDAYPRYREAQRKAGIDLDFRLPVLFDLSPHVITSEFDVVAPFWEIHHAVRALSDRAPPSLA